MLNRPHIGKAGKMKDQDTVKREKGPAAGGGTARDLPQPPDGGYGWVVVIAAFLINAILGVILYFYINVTWDILYYYYGYTVGLRTLSLINAMHLLSSPLASILMNRFGSRRVAISGALITTFVAVISILCPNDGVRSLTTGIIGGFGLGMMYLPAVVSVSFYFEKRRALMTGIVFLGSGVGYFIGTPLYQVFINFNILLMLAATSLQGVVCGALLRPLRASCPKQKQPEHTNRDDNIVDEANEEIWVRQSSISDTPSHVSGDLQLGSCDNINRGGIHKVMRSFVQLSGLYLLADPLFLILALANLGAMLGRSIQLFFRNLHRGLMDDYTGEIARLLTLIIAISAALGLILVGCLGDSKCVNSLLLHNIAITSSGIACILNMFCVNYISYFASIAYIGICMDAWRVLSPLILCELQGVEKLASSYGILCFVQEISSLVGPPIAVLVYEVTEWNVNSTSITGGILLVIGGSISFLLHLPYFQRRTHANRRLAQKKQELRCDDLTSPQINLK